MAAQDIVIVSAARTPVGSFSGAFATTPAHDLGAVAIKAALERAGVEGSRSDEVILGQILTAARARTPARQAAHEGGHSRRRKTAWAHQPALRLRPSHGGHRHAADRQRRRGIIVAGGQESMSLAAPMPPICAAAPKMGDFKLVDTMLKDGLLDASTATTWAPPPRTWPRWQADPRGAGPVRVASQNKAEAAQKDGRFKDEIAPFTISTRKGRRRGRQRRVHPRRHHHRRGAKLKPAFSKDGTVTAANASASTTAPRRWC
jgi:acetyl-CoA C-acetyltransferase